MPITPLHLGIIPVITKVTKKPLSIGSFLLVNCLIDFPVLLQMQAIKTHEYGGPAVMGTLHSGIEHTFIGALVLGLSICIVRVGSLEWIAGCIYGVLSHIALDMFVHYDVRPFEPQSAANPFFMDDAHAVLSILLTIGLVVEILRWIDRKQLIQRSSERIND